MSAPAPLFFRMQKDDAGVVRPYLIKSADDTLAHDAADAARAYAAALSDADVHNVIMTARGGPAAWEAYFGTIVDARTVPEWLVNFDVDAATEAGPAALALLRCFASCVQHLVFRATPRQQLHAGVSKSAREESAIYFTADGSPWGHLTLTAALRSLFLAHCSTPFTCRMLLSGATLSTFKPECHAARRKAVKTDLRNAKAAVQAARAQSGNSAVAAWVADKRRIDNAERYIANATQGDKKPIGKVAEKVELARKLVESQRPKVAATRKKIPAAKIKALMALYAARDDALKAREDFNEEMRALMQRAADHLAEATPETWGPDDHPAPESKELNDAAISLLVQKFGKYVTRCVLRTLNTAERRTLVPSKGQVAADGDGDDDDDDGDVDMTPAQPKRAPARRKRRAHAEVDAEPEPPAADAPAPKRKRNTRATPRKRARATATKKNPEPEPAELPPVELSDDDEIGSVPLDDDGLDDDGFDDDGFDDSFA